MGSAVANLFKGNFATVLNDAKKGIRDLSGVDATVKAIVSTKNLTGSFSNTFAQRYTQELAKDQPSSTPAISRSVQAIDNSKSARNSTRVVYSPNVTINGSSEAGKQDFKKMLKDHKNDLIDIVDSNNRNKSRLSFQ